jgi:hypothetical protein
MAVLCDNMLYRGDLEQATPALVKGFLDSLMKVRPAAKVLCWFLRAVVSSSTTGTSLIIHSRYLARFAKALPEGFVPDSQIVAALVSFSRSCAEAEYHVVRKLCCSMLLGALPALLRSSPDPSLVSFDAFRVFLSCMPPGPFVSSSVEFRALQELVGMIHPTGQWLLHCLFSAVCQFINTKDPILDPDTINKMRSSASELAPLFAFIAKDHEAVSRVLEPAVAVCRKVYSHPYGAGAGLAERALTLVGKVSELLLSTKSLASEQIIARLAGTLDECSEECFAFIELKLHDRTPTFLDRIVCYSDWLAAAALAGQWRSQLRVRGLKLAATELVPRLTNPTTSVTELMAVLSLLHALAVRGSLAVCNADVCRGILQSIPVFDGQLPKAELQLVAGIPWGQRLPLASQHAWELVLHSATVPPPPLAATIDWKALTKLSESPAVGAAGLSALLSSLRAWVAAGILPPPLDLDAIATVTFNMFEEFAYHKPLLRSWVDFVFSSHFVTGRAYQPVLSKFIAKAMALGERNALIVNLMTDRVVAGW